MLTRRQLMRASLFGGIAALGVGSGAAFVRFLWAREEETPNEYRVRARRVPASGAPPLATEAFYLVNVSDREAKIVGRSAGGLMAVSRACTHLPELRCPPTWIGDFSFPDPDAGGQIITGWIRCPCHGSTFSMSGRRVFGPAPRSLDAFEITVRSNGEVIVDTSKVVRGGIENEELELRRP